MKKNDVISYFGGVGKTAKALNISHSSANIHAKNLPTC